VFPTLITRSDPYCSLLGAPSKQELTISLMDMKGRQVHQSDYQPGSSILIPYKVSPGQYLFRALNLNGEVFIGKIIIK